MNLHFSQRLKALTPRLFQSQRVRSVRPQATGRRHALLVTGAEGLEERVLLSTFERVADIVPDSGSSSPHSFTSLGGKLYFSASVGATGRELWRYDPTTNSTSLVADINPGSASGLENIVQPFTVLNNQLFFLADDGVTGRELWKHDPATSTTTRVADLRSGPGSPEIDQLIGLDNKLYFAADDGVAGAELWRHDPATNTTTRVTDIRAGSAGSFPTELAALGGKLYFSALEGTAGQELWRYDPATSTAARVADINPGTAWSSPNQITPMGGQLYFKADDGATGQEPWRHDPVTNTTVRVADVNPGLASSTPLRLTAISGLLYFQADDGVHGRELWRHDPGTNTTALVADLKPGVGSSLMLGDLSPVPLDGKIYFAADDGGTGRELWRHDPGTNTTTLVADVNTSGGSAPTDLTVLGGKLYFSADDGASGQELWRHDPTTGTTALVADLWSGGGSVPSYLTVMDDQLYFSANDGATGLEPWVFVPNPRPIVGIGDVTATEGGAAVVTLTLSQPSSQDTSVRITTVNGTAASGVDFSGFSLGVTITIPAGAVTATRSISTINDSTSEPTESFFVNLSSPVGLTIGDGQGIVTILDNDQPSVSIGDVTVSEGGAAVVTLTLTNPSYQDTSVLITTVSDTAFSGVDFSGFSLGFPINFAAGTVTASRTVTILNDSTYEPTESFFINLSTPVGLTIGDAQGVVTILDDDFPTVSIGDVTVTEGGTAQVTLTLDYPSYQDTSITISTLDGSAAAATDYAAISQGLTITIPAGSVTATGSIATTNDLTSEPTESFLVNLSAPNGLRIGDGQGIVTILDNDQPSVSIGDVTVSEGGAAVVTLTLTNPSYQDTSVLITTVSGTALSGVDFSGFSLGFPINFAAGTVTASRTVTILNDSTYEPTESFFINLSTPVGLTIGDAQGVVTILDDDMPTVSFTTSAITVAENAGVVSLTIQLDQPAPTDLTIPLSIPTIPNQPSLGVDYTLVGQPVVIAAGSTSAVLLFTVLEDALDEPMEYLRLELGATSDVRLGAVSELMVSIQDNDLAPAVAFTTSSQSVGEDAGSVSVIARLSALSGYAVTIPVLRSGSATFGTDYSFPNGSTITIPAGSLEASLAVVIANDASPEGNESITLTMGSPINARKSTAPGAALTHTLTINANDAPSAKFLVANRTIYEGTSYTLSVELSETTPLGVSIPLVLSGTAQSQTDYSLTSSVITINANERTGSTTITVWDDNLGEALEDLSIAMGTPTNAQLGTTTTFLGSIPANEKPTVYFSSWGSSKYEDEGELLVTARLDNPSSQKLTVPITVNGSINGVFEGGNYKIVDRAFVFEPGVAAASIKIQLTDNSINQNDVKLELQLTDQGVTNPAFYLPPHIPYDQYHNPQYPWYHKVQIQDNDPYVYFASKSQSADENDGAVTVDVTLSSPSNRAITVPISYSGKATAGSSGDYTAPSTVTIPAFHSSAPLTMTLRNNSVYEADQSFTAKIGASITNAAGRKSPYEHTVTIVDDDLPTVKFSASPKKPVNETVGNVTVTLTLSNTSEVDTIVPITIDGTATQGSDFKVSTAAGAITTKKFNVRIPANTTSKPSATITIRVINDSDVEDVEDLKLRMGRPTNASNGSSYYLPTYTLKIQSDDVRVEPKTEPVIIVDSGPLYYGVGQIALVLGGYLDGSVVFFDANKNGTLDFLDVDGDGFQGQEEPSEASAVTMPDGRFVLNIPEEFDLDGDGIVSSDEGRLVALGGIDSASGLPLAAPLIAPGGSFVVSPFTTLMSALVDHHGMTLDQAAVRVHEALGLPEQVDLMRFDAIAATLAGQLDGAAVFAADSKLMDTVGQLSGLLGGALAGSSPSFLASTIYADLAAKIAEPAAELNLSAPEVLTSVIEGLLFRTGAILDPGTIAGAAQVIAAGNQQIDSVELVPGENFLEQMSKAQTVAQGDVTDRLADLGAGLVSAEDVLASSTGQALVDQIAATTPNDVVPSTILFSDLTRVESNGGTVVYEFTASLDRPSNQTVSIRYETTDATATLDDGDYEATSGLLTWAPGDTSTRTIQVIVHGDSTFEADETFLLVLSEAEHALPTQSLVRGTIVNDDALTFSAPTSGLGNQISLVIDGELVTLECNAETVFSGTLSSPVPITILGANGEANELVIDLRDLAATALGAGIVFLGGDQATDRLIVLDGTATVVSHIIGQSGAGAGTINVDGSLISYQGIETVSDLLTAGISGVPASALEGSPLSFTAQSPRPDAPDLLAFDWSLTRNGTPFITGYGSSFTTALGDDGDYTLTLTATNLENGAVGTTVRSFLVTNAPPLVVPTTLELVVDEGQSASNSGTWSDPGADLVTLSASIGAVIRNDDGTWSWSFSTTDGPNASQTVTITATDSGNLSTQTAFTLTVNNLAPNVTPDAVSTIEDAPVTLNVLANDSDAAGANDPLVVTAVTQGTHGSVVINANGTLSYSPHANYSGTDSFTYTVSDGDGGSSTALVNVTIIAVADDPSLTASSPGGVEGAAIPLVITPGLVDADGSEVLIGVRVRGVPTGSTFNHGALVGTFDGLDVWSMSAEDLPGLLFTAADGPSAIVLTLTAFSRELSNLSTAESSLPISLAITNAPPTATLQVPSSSSEGSPVTVALTNPFDLSIDDRAAGFTYAFDTGAGYSAFSASSSVTFTPLDNGSRIVRARIRDKDGGITDYQATITIDNVVPAVGPIVAPLAASLSASTLQVNASFDDLGVLDTHTAVWSWGDGQTSTGIVSESGGSGSATGNHTYVVSGTYTITLTVTDKDGGVGLRTLQRMVLPYILLLDPTGSGALGLSGNAEINVPGEIMVDSSSVAAVSASGNARIQSAGLRIVGGYQVSGHASLGSPVSTGAAVMADPLAGLQAPMNAIARGSVNLGGGNALTISPGVYTQIKVAGNARLVMEPGVYVIAGGGFAVSGNAEVHGTGVMIYNAGGSFPASGGNFGGISISGGGEVRLTPAAEGAYAGVLIFQARDNARALAISGNASAMSGIVYAPSARFMVTGQGLTSLPMIVGSLGLSGNATSTLTSEGGLGSTSFAAGQLLSRDLLVSVNDAGDRFSIQELARIGDVVEGLSSLLAPYGVTVALVGPADFEFANVVIDASISSPLGGAAEGILGCETEGSAGSLITLVRGWDWYAGSDPSALSPGQYDFATVVLHEMGHALGLGHGSDPSSPMHDMLEPGVARRALSIADLMIPEVDHGPDGLLAAVPIRPATIAPLVFARVNLGSGRRWDRAQESLAVGGLPSSIWRNPLGPARPRRATLVLDSGPVATPDRVVNPSR